MTNLKYRHGGTFMFKKFFSFLIFFFCFSTSCHGVLMEILDGDFSSVVDTEAKTAVVRFVYIPAHTKKDIEIPEYVTDFRGDKYLVKEIQENAIKKVIHRSKSISLPKSLSITEETFKAMTWFVIYGLPIKVRT